MKKLMTLITAAMLLSSASSFAGNVNQKVINVFKKEFSEATDVNWIERDDYYLVEFKIAEVWHNVAYNDNGDVLAASTYLPLKELPEFIKKIVAEKYSGYVIKNNPIVLEMDGLTYYVLSVSNAHKEIKIKVTDKGRITLEPTSFL